METLVLHNILRSDAAEKCGKDPVEDEYLRMVDPMVIPLVYVLVAFSIGKTDEQKHTLNSAEELVDQLRGTEPEAILPGLPGIFESCTQGLSHGKVSSSGGAGVAHTGVRCPVEYVPAFVDGGILSR